MPALEQAAERVLRCLSSGKSPSLPIATMAGIPVVLRQVETSPEFLPAVSSDSERFEALALEVRRQGELTDAALRAVRDLIVETTSVSEKTVDAVRTTAADIAAGQRGILDALDRVVRTLSLPVRPVYDDRGKLIGARRGE